MRTPSPKPANFDRLTETWNDPGAFAAELNQYYEQLRAADDLPADVTEPRRSTLW